MVTLHLSACNQDNHTEVKQPSLFCCVMAAMDSELSHAGLGLLGAKQ